MDPEIKLEVFQCSSDVCKARSPKMDPDAAVSVGYKTKSRKIDELLNRHKG